MFNNKVKRKHNTLFVGQNVPDLLSVSAETWSIGVSTQGFNLTAARFVLRAEVSEQVFGSHRVLRTCCAPCLRD